MVDRISELTEILPYVREFQGKLFVVKMGGEIASGQSLVQIARQLSLIHHIGIRTVLVHGGGPQLTDLLGRLGIEGRVVGGRRVTDEQTLDAAKMVFAGLVSTNIVAALKTQGASAIGLSGADAGLIRASRRPPRRISLENGDETTVDFGLVGDVQGINCEMLDMLFKQKVIPVIGSLGIDEQGQVLNINADTVASALARELNAEKLIVLTNVPGVLKNREDLSSLLSYISVEDLRRMIAEGSIRDGMLPKVEACIAAIEGGVSRTHIIDGARAGSLLMELFLNQGCGTMIVGDAERQRYESVR